MPSRREQQTARRETIANVVETQAIESQEQLVGVLAGLGFDVSQGTLSRDLKALHIAKVPGADGVSLYRVANGAEPGGVQIERLKRDMRSQLLSARVAGQMVLLFTPPGGAQLLGRAVDEIGWSEVEGTIAGDDTVLVVTRGPKLARAVREKIATWARS